MTLPQLPFTSLTVQQQEIAGLPLRGSLFLEGPAGCGKTTAALWRLLGGLREGLDGGSVLLLVPQRTLAEPYVEALRTGEFPPGGGVDVTTLGGLARRMVDLFWPLAVSAAGFAHLNRPPVFLTLETAQYFMAHLLDPHLERGMFDSVVIERSRLYSQVIDGLNKSAVVGFPFTEIGARLRQAWSGEPGQLRIYEDVQLAATWFREYCLAHNLLDFSLQMEVFVKHLWPHPICRDYLYSAYRHLFADNLEEDTPAAHELLADWLPELESATLVYDWEAGYRRFLGASPDTACELKNICQSHFVFEQSLVASPAVAALSHRLATSLAPNLAQIAPASPTGEAQQALVFQVHRFYPQMLDWVTEQVKILVRDRGVAPREIVVLAPYLSDSLRFALSSRLDRFQIPSHSHRPSRALRDEPVVRGLLTLAALAHPSWGISPPKLDVVYALVQVIEGLDLVRAKLLVDIVYRRPEQGHYLSSFDRIRPEIQERITHRLGERYEGLRLWLEEYSRASVDELDHFLSRLFGEVLSQRRYGFHHHYQAGEVTANLVESIQKFRWAAGPALQDEGCAIGQEYVQMVKSGIIASQYMRSWSEPQADAVFLAPAYTFLLSNRPVSYQIWLDAGSRGWVERLYQPLTHPYVLSKNWRAGQPWTEADEIRTGQENLYYLAMGLLRRCREQIYLGLSELGESGYEQRGPLLHAFQRLLVQFHREQANAGNGEARL
jgi:hypothetical protein